MSASHASLAWRLCIPYISSCTSNRFQPQTSPRNYEKAMLIKIVALFRNLLISSFDATIPVNRAFVYFKTRSSNDCEVTAMHSMRPIDRQRKIPVTHYFCLSERLTRQHFYQNDFFQNDSSFALLLSWIIIIFSAVATENLCQSTIFS